MEKRQRQQQVYEAIAEVGATVFDLARALQVTPNCVRVTLTELASRGLLTRVKIRGSNQRPIYFYRHRTAA